MKKIIACLAIFALLISASFPLSGQGFLERISKRASKKIEQKAEEKANEKVDETIDEGFNQAESAIEGSDTLKPKLTQEERDQRRLSNILGKMGVSSEPATIADSYHFTFKLKMAFKTVKKNGKVDNEGEIVTYAIPGEPNFAYEFLSGEIKNNKAPSTGLFLMDFTNNVTLILSEENGKKTGIAIGMGNMTEEDTWKDLSDEETEESEIDYTHPNIKKTGRTKNILGYSCEEYEYADEKSIAQFWITKTLKASTRDIYASIFQSALYSRGVINGFLLESEQTDLESGEKNNMWVTEINENASQTFSTKEYEIMNMGSINMPTKEE